MGKTFGATELKKIIQYIILIIFEQNGSYLALLLFLKIGVAERVEGQ